jgi:RIO kinase 1
MHNDRQARKKRKPEVVHKPKKTHHEILEEIADPIGLEGGFKTTYVPGIFEEEWLLSSLRDFYDMEFISDVLGRVRGGKEASVYRCAATAQTGMSLAAAKVYRPRKMRNLRNDAMYRENRQYLTADGKAVNDKDWRMLRHIEKKSRSGEQVQHMSWLTYEFKTLQRLRAAGADVPEAVSASENAILMGYRGDSEIAAPTLNTVSLEEAEARRIFDAVLRNVELMLSLGLIHGDLSAYNILYWQGEITLIDFPQVIDYGQNTNAYSIFQRDVTRVCEYFTTQGVDYDPLALSEQLWKRYVEGDAASQIAESLRLAEEGE